MALGYLKLNLLREIPSPHRNQSPSEYAAKLAELYASVCPVGKRGALGQFFTPLEVAQFMASLTRQPSPIRSILDPGAGTGVLGCAVCETLVGKTRKVHLEAFEVDETLADLCDRALRHARAWLAERDVDVTFRVHAADFVLERAAMLSPGLFDASGEISYDLIVANPPYFKLQKTDSRSVAAAAVNYGQPNIYAIFMAICASILSEEGIMVTITPRSFATGEYFSKCRQYLFSRVVPEAVHLFHSRKAAFKHDAVLQENVILRAKKGKSSEAAMVEISTSRGLADIPDRRSRTVRLASVVEMSSAKAIFHIPAGDTDERLLGFIRSWPNTLHSLGLDVSTGPVVAFRSRRFLMAEPSTRDKHVPLLWLQNIRQMAVEWPLSKNHKPQYIIDTSDSRGLLVPNETYVLVRRFTTKEERRRLIAAPLLKHILPSRMIGLENHLNYVYRPHGEIGEDEAFGLAVILDSGLLDSYFRISNGNTQVNATELRSLPLPTRDIMMRLGSAARKRVGLLLNIDALVEDTLGVPLPLRSLSKAG